MPACCPVTFLTAPSSGEARPSYPVRWRLSTFPPAGRSALAAARVPVPLEIGDQRRAEMAIGLLARIDRHIAAEGVERFLRDAEGAAIAGGAHHSRIGEAVDDSGDRSIHRRRLGDLVADQRPRRAGPIQPSP